MLQASLWDVHALDLADTMGERVRSAITALIGCRLLPPCLGFDTSASTFSRNQGEIKL